MTEENAPKTDASTAKPAVGDFPFPLSAGPEESQYLNWVRNHSNYMVARGFLDYMRTAAALARGIVINFLVLLPLLLIVAIVLGYYHYDIVDRPFYWTGWVLAFAAGLILFFTVFLPVFRIKQYKRSVETGSESSVRSRDLVERFFGAMLLSIIVVAVLESIPLLLEFIRHELPTQELGWKGLLMTAGAAVTFLSGSHKVLSVLGGIKKQLALVLIAMVGLVLPLAVILYATDFLLYGPVLPDLFILFPLALPLVLFVAAQIALVFSLFGWLQRVHTFKEIQAVQFRLFFAYMILAILVGLVSWQFDDDKDEIEEAIDSVEQIRALASSIDRISQTRDAGPNALVEAVVRRGRDMERHGSDLCNFGDEHPPLSRQDGIIATFINFFTLYTPPDGTSEEMATQEPIERVVEKDVVCRREKKEYLAAAEPLIDAVYDLSGHSEGLPALRKEIAGAAPYRILDLIRENHCRVYEDADADQASEDAAICLRTEFVKAIAIEWINSLPALDQSSVEEKVKEYSRLFAEYDVPGQILWQLEYRLEASSTRDVAELLSNGELINLLRDQNPETGDGGCRYAANVLESLRRQQLMECLTDAHKEAAVSVASSSLVVEIMELTHELGTYIEESKYYVPYDDERIAEIIQPMLDDYASGTLLPSSDHLGSEDGRLTILREPVSYELATVAFNQLFEPHVSDFEFGVDEWETFATVLAFGQAGLLEPTYLRSVANVRDTKVMFLLLLAFAIWFVWRVTVDVNLTSIHALYRDRLASAFLVGRDTKGDVGIEEDIDLDEICQYNAGSVAPYHLINVALNLQGSKDISIRDRRSDFFIFSKRFIGGDRTGYCRSATMEQVFPQMDLATAMAISAAAASPNMGRGTSPLLVAFMTLLNIRLGFWMPNPGILEEVLAGTSLRRLRKERKELKKVPGFTRGEVLKEELKEIDSRWRNVYGDSKETERGRLSAAPTTANRLLGLGFSGGGIRSAAINLGIAQTLHKRGVFKHVDFLSTVSGGGYLGSSISTLMRFGDDTRDRGESRKAMLNARLAGRRSKVFGTVTALDVDTTTGEKVVKVRRRSVWWGRRMIAGFLNAIKTSIVDDSPSPNEQPDRHEEEREFRFCKFDSLAVKEGGKVKPGQDLIVRQDTLTERFRWRVRPVALLREMASQLDETHRWVNLSDGGHIENLAGIELLRRRCKYIIIGDGEADPDLFFGGLATLMRCARLDLGIEIDIDLDAIRLAKSEKGESVSVSRAQWAIGKITYPNNDAGEPGTQEQPDEGYLLYLKSAVTGHENELVREYRNHNPAFPHQTTADQFFDEAQFEAYRSLGQHIAEMAFDGKYIPEPATDRPPSEKPPKSMSFAKLEGFFERLWDKHSTMD